MKLRSLSTARRTPAPAPQPHELTGSRRRTVVVALRRDAAGRELLAWALVKAAAARDRVVALHVAVSPAPAAAADGRGMGVPAPEEGETGASAGATAAAESLASVLAAYKGFCDRNQIDLELRVREGPSVKKALVAEATSCCAAQLVLGVADTSKPLRSSAAARAVARYCAKRVPPTCAVTAVSNGAVVYCRDAAQQPPTHCSSAAETPRSIYRKILDATMSVRDRAQDDSAIGDGRSLRRDASVPTSDPVTLSPGRLRCSRLQSPEVATGWPFLRKKLVADRKLASPDLSEVPVVQWAMQLPTRCPAPSPLNSDKVSDDREVVRSKIDSGKPSPVKPAKKLPEELVSLRDKYSSKYATFTCSDIAKLTDGFSPERIIGKGGTGRVYRGRGQDGKELAVKVLNSSAEVTTEFVSEVDILSSVGHRNVISLAGFCLDGGELMLVYEYMPRGSLEEMLHGDEKRGKGVFGWPERFNVAVGVARALEYLHGGGGGGDRKVIHRDVKSSNILIADDFEAKLCDFGLALWAKDAASLVTGDDVAGTFGYLAPEYFMHGKVSDKIDVYAFGVVLLELISGRKPVSAGGPKGQESLVMWASSVVQGGKLTDLVDPSLPMADGDAGEVERMALAAALCIRREPQRRPSMSNVLELLAGDGDALRWARSQAGVSGYDDDDISVATSLDRNDIQSYINLALLDGVEDDAASVGSFDFVGANMSLEDYMKGRWSRSSSFD